MRKALIVSFMWLAASAVATAQGMGGSYGGGYGGGQQPQQPTHRPSGNNQSGHGGQNGHDDGPPPPPPIPRCADLAVTSLGFTTAVPGGAPLSGDEVALQYDVHNAGTATYTAPSGASQSLSLEYSTPGGTHQVATLPLPAQAAGATPAAAQSVSLAQGQSWRGYMRMTLPPEARRWPMRLKLSFTNSSSPYAARISDCDPDNDQVQVQRP
jgi:hypothetical protein